MPECFKLKIPMAGENGERTLKTGDILFVLGANGSGKSGLISKLFNDYSRDAKRISAHRQTWFVSNAPELTPDGRESLKNSIRSQDKQAHSRWREDYATERAVAAIYDLIDADTMLAREIVDLLRDKKSDEALEKANSPSPIQSLNELLQTLEPSNRRSALRRVRGSWLVEMAVLLYSVAELSDGERNAFLIAAASSYR